MPQTTETTEYRQRITKLQQAMKEYGLSAVILEPGPAMVYLTGARWGKSERTFVMVLPATGEPSWVLPGFEEERAREQIHVGEQNIRVWQEDQSPYERVAQILKDHGVTKGRVGFDEGARFFVFDGIRKLAKLEYVGTAPVLKMAGVETAPEMGGRRGGGKK